MASSSVPTLVSNGRLPVAVAIVHPLRAHLTPARAGQHVDLGGHQPLGELAHHLPQQIVLVAVELLAQPVQRVHRVVDHRVLPLARLGKDCKRLTRWSSRPRDLRPLHHYLGLNCVGRMPMSSLESRRTSTPTPTYRSLPRQPRSPLQGCSTLVDSIALTGGRATGVRLADHRSASIVVLLTAIAATS